ncbi:MAG: peptidyl-prolyl cis-trans isomerase B (cyclophilin B) [Bacteroidia bacterium]|jgi:peptidyl-prolyl cis-trans isomerase B (cyclophilin B)
MKAQPRYPINHSLLIVTLLLLLGSTCKKEVDNSKPEVQSYPIAKVHTTYGDMHFWMSDSTPNHKAKFIELAREKHYDQFSFNRVIKNFVIQGGCPDLPQYFENSPYLLDAEFNDSLTHVLGAVGIGRDDNPEKRSNACQFYIVAEEKGLPNLDGDYVIFGHIIKGLDVLKTIEMVPTNSKDEPTTTIPLEVTIEEYTADEIKERFGILISELK